MPSSRGSSHPGMEPGPPAFQRDSYQLSHQGSPVWRCLSYLKCSFFLSSMFNLALCIGSFQIYLPSRSQSRLPLSALFGLPSAPCEVRPGTSNPGVRVLGNKASEASDCKLRLQKASSRLLPGGRPALPGCLAGHVHGSSWLHTIRTEPGGTGARTRRGRGRSAWAAIKLPGRDGGSAAAGPGVAPGKPLLEPRAPGTSAGPSSGS